MTRDLAKIRVIGIGNGDRGDDGIGALVAGRLEAELKTDVSVSVLTRRGDGLALIEDWAGAAAAILVDAAAPMTKPGAIHRIDLKAAAPPTEPSLSSTHAFGISQAVGLAEALDLLPGHLILYAIEGACFNPGAPLTPEVAAAAEHAVRRILSEISAFGRHQAGVCVHA